MSNQDLQKLFDAALRELPPHELEDKPVAVRRPFVPDRQSERVADEETLQKLFEAALRETAGEETEVQKSLPAMATSA